MTIGEKIKRIREFRDMTQKNLGIALGYPDNSAPIRIAQYESDDRVPKKETLLKISGILNCSLFALGGKCRNRVEDSIEQLFWIEDNYGPFVLFPLKTMASEDEQSDLAFGYCKSLPYWEAQTAITLKPESSFLMRAYMAEWEDVNRLLWSRKISEGDYFEWKINWPDSRDKMNEYIDKLKACTQSGVTDKKITPGT